MPVVLQVLCDHRLRWGRPPQAARQW
jgi:hypothetical protein